MTSPAWAQDPNLKALLDRVDRLQRELATLQRQVYRGEPPPASAVQGAGAAELSGTQAARLEVRMSQFEQQLRSLTGQLEEQSFRINRLSQQLDALTADLDQRLQPPAAGTQGSAGAAPTTAGQAAVGSAPGTIGSISPEELAAVQTQVGGGAAQQAALGTDDSPQAQYDRAFSLLSQTQYEEAGRAFDAFLQMHPGHKLAGNAKYWLGETYYVQGQYTEAAVTFAEGFQDYPESAKAPDNLLKLGKSLAALDQTEDACGTFAELIKRYTAAPPTILQQAKAEQKRLGCP
jgi:tol-pal system protein YbgF